MPSKNLRTAHLPLLALLAAALASPALGSDYAVLVSKQTDADPAWHKVVQRLTEKHAVAGQNASVITFDGDITTARDALAAAMPLYTAIVARPEELGRGVVANIHRMMRRLDDDPYTDTIWGIVTGLSADDALTLVSDDKPLVMKRAVSTTGVHDGLFEQVFTVSDGAEGQWTLKSGDTTTKGGTKDDAERKSDRAVLFSQRMAEIQPDLIVSSSHGFEYGIEMPFSHGMLIGKGGRLAMVPQNDGEKGAGEARLGKPVTLEPSTNPKVFLPVGNCLTGHIDPRHIGNSIILAMQRSAAVRQSVAYTIETWYGRAGWGTLGLLESQPGNFTVAQAWFFNEQQIVEELRKKHEKAAGFDFDWTDESSVKSFMAGAQKAGLKGSDKDEMGLAFDRDVVALYGDPAYDARLDATKWNAPFTATIDASGADLAVTIKVKDRAFHGPAMLYFPRRCTNPKASVSLPEGSILADNFLIISDVSKVADEGGGAILRIVPGPTN
jgi:zinc protease